VAGEPVEERIGDRAGRGPGDELGDHAEPGVVVDPGDDGELGAIDQAHAAHDIDLLQLQGPGSLPALVVLPAAPAGLRGDEAVADRHR